MNSNNNFERFPSKDELKLLQTEILRAILLRKPVLGATNSVFLPDLNTFQKQSRLIVASDNLSGSISIKDSPVPIYIMSLEEIKSEAKEKGDLVYLQFKPVQVINNIVKLSISARISTQDPKTQTLGLSGMVVTFKKIEGKWIVLEEPTYFAM